MNNGHNLLVPPQYNSNQYSRSFSFQQNPQLHSSTQPASQTGHRIVAPRQIFRPKRLHPAVPNFTSVPITPRLPELISNGMDKRSPSSFQQLEKVFLSQLLHHKSKADKLHSLARALMQRYSWGYLYDKIILR